MEIKGSKSVTLLSTEAECVAISEAVRKLKFIYQVMSSLEIEVKLPIRVNVDNVGAIFLAKNKNASEKTKHVDVRHHYVWKLMNVLWMKFIDIFNDVIHLVTKNHALPLSYKSLDNNLSILHSSEIESLLLSS